jgi:hypothetical protein
MKTLDPQIDLPPANAAGLEPPAKPPEISVWNDDDYELLHTLSCRIPLLSKAQAIRLLKSQGCRRPAATTGLEQLHVAGWLERYRGTTPWPPLQKAPRIGWVPGQSRPDLRQLRISARREIADDVPRVVTFYVASRLTANLFGTPYRGTVGLDRVREWIAWAGVYLQLLQDRPELAACCDSSGIRNPGQPPGPLPSHLRVAGSERPRGFIGLLAHSSLPQLLALHQHCRHHVIPYSLW